MKRNVLIIGAGGVASAAVHKCAMNSEILGDICIASRTISKCDALIEAFTRRRICMVSDSRLFARQVDATNKADVVDLIRETGSEIVLNLGSNFLNMTVMDACLEANAAYLDTSAHSEPESISYAYPWYEQFEWKRKMLFAERRLTAILSVGFDPGVVNAYAAHGLKHELDTIDEIDIFDVNAGEARQILCDEF
jgi:saccharopine dehydrogenase-like NADP-dependent oxidoreductase